MKKVLLTGATGFIGRNCIAGLLAKGYDVHAVYLNSVAENLPSVAEKDAAVHWHQVDLHKQDEVDAFIKKTKPDHLLHLAWYAVPGKFWTASENLDWAISSLSLLRAFITHGGQRVVMAGTCAEYDWGYGYCSEQVTPLAPASFYGACKHSLQITLEALSRQAGISSAWGRIFFLYGPHENSQRLFPSVISSLLKGENARCTHGEQIRDFLYVKDVANAFVSLLESNVSGAVNIASGRPIAIKEIVSKIADKLNCADRVELGALPADSSEPRLLVADVKRLTEEVGWTPEFDLDSGIDHTIEYWKKRIK